MWDETSRDETSSGTKRPRTKHPRDETEIVRNIQHPLVCRQMVEPNSVFAANASAQRCILFVLLAWPYDALLWPVIVRCSRQDKILDLSKKKRN